MKYIWIWIETGHVDCSLICGNEVVATKRNHEIRMLESKLTVFGEKQTVTKSIQWTKFNTQITLKKYNNIR